MRKRNLPAHKDQKKRKQKYKKFYRRHKNDSIEVLNKLDHELLKTYCALLDGMSHATSRRKRRKAEKHFDRHMAEQCALRDLSSMYRTPNIPLRDRVVFIPLFSRENADTDFLWLFD
jgi:hypothetical protein